MERLFPGLIKTYSTPAALSWATSRAPPVPRTSRIQEGGPSPPASSAGRTKADRERTIELAAAVVIPQAPRPDRKFRLEIPPSKNCFIRSFIEFLLSARSEYFR